MTLDKIVAISGKPGLFEIKSQTKGGVIVESLEDKKRFPVNSVQNISSLSDIAIYTYETEIPLKEVFTSMHQNTEGKEALSHKSNANDLKNYFLEVLPNYDEERVYVSNIKKIVQWFNILVANNFDFSTLIEEEKEEKAAE